MTDNQSQEFLRELRRGIMECFDISDLRVLCADLGFDYEDLAGDDKKAKVVDLILDMNRRGEITRLLHYCASERPEHSWPQPSSTWQRPRYRGYFCGTTTLISSSSFNR